MSAVTLDSAAFTAPAGLDLGTVSGGHPEKTVKFRIGLFSYKNRRKDVFEAADDISSVSLITESVVRFGVFIDLPIRRGFREGGKVGVKQIDKELLLNRNGSGTVKLFQEELVLELVILQFQAPAFEVKLFEIIPGVLFVKKVGTLVPCTFAFLASSKKLVSFFEYYLRQAKYGIDT